MATTGAADDFPPPPFAGFKPAAFTFFRDLAANQDRAWFAAHKAHYDTVVRAPMEALVSAVSERLRADGLPFAGDPARAMFRLNRDVRFSADKSPYKTHASAALTRDGQKASPGVLYLHIDPGGSFVACGFFRPEPDALARLRAGLVARPDDWARVETALATAKLVLARDDVLARPPKGFDDAPASVGAALKLKSWVVRRELSAAAIKRAGLVDTIADFAGSAAALLRFGWAALDGAAGTIAWRQPSRRA